MVERHEGVVGYPFFDFSFFSAFSLFLVAGCDFFGIKS